MQVAHLTSTFPVISQTFILNQLSGLIERGHEVTIFAEDRPDTAVEHELLQEYDLFERAVYSGQPSTYLEGASLLLDAIPDLLRSGYGPHRVAAQFRHGKDTPKRLARLRDVLRHASKQELIHAHFGTTGNTALPAQQLTELPLVVSFYGYDVSRTPRSNPAVYDELFERVAAMTCLSKDMKDDLIELGGQAEKIHKVPLCVDPSKFEYRERTLASDEPIQLLTVARHVEKKGLRYAIEAVAQLDLERPVTYAIAGDGPRRDQLEVRIDELDAGDRIETLGWQTQEEISRLMANAHIFVLPSVTAANGNKEGTPTVLLEAQSAGLPVISTRHAGIPEIVSDGEAGYLVPERNVPALVDALERLLSQPERWSEMGKAGRGYTETHHSIESVTDELVSVYRRVV